MNIDQFKERLLSEDLSTVLESILLSPDAKHVDNSQKDHIKNKLANKYNVPIEQINIIVVGSAKLGFSISEKVLNDGRTLPRYRNFSLYSDIDLAIICPPIFEKIWNELTNYSHRQAYFPWVSRRLGDYFICGWLRPDYFPNGVSLRYCDDWWDTFRDLTARRFFGRRKVRGALFYNFEQLKAYQARSFKECLDIEIGKI
jgi:hypothetical protein